MSETRQFPAAVSELSRLAATSAAQYARRERDEWRRIDKSLTWRDRADAYRDAAACILPHLAAHKHMMALSQAADRRAAAWCALAERKGDRAVVLRRNAGLWRGRVPA